MAKKIIISFLSQPLTTEAGWQYAIESNGFQLPYNSGLIDCNIGFVTSGSTQTLTEVPLGANLSETLTITLAHLREFYVNSAIDYNIVNNTIEVLINAEVDIIVSETINANILITQSEVEPSIINLKYFIIFDDYVLDIYQKNYLGFSTEIFGAISINKGSVSTILEPIRGTGLSIALEANSALTFDEFSLSDEFTYKTQLRKGGQVIFNGYIKPDGIQQSFINNEWLVNIESVDGLGLLKDLSFVKSNGLQFTGKISMYDAIKGCLDRTGLIMTVNTAIEIEYNGYSGTNILKDIYINSERFIKNERDTIIMDCNEVLTSILNLFSGVITQQDGQWYIYRPNDLVLNGFVTFINQDTNVTFTKNLTKFLGSQIDNFYPHHCDANQQIEMKGAISAYRLNYEYGFLDGFVINKNLVHDDEYNFENWTVIDESLIVLNPLDDQGLIMNGAFIFGSPTFDEVLISQNYLVNNNAILEFKANLTSDFSSNQFAFKIKTNTGYYLNNSGEWTLTDSIFGTTTGASGSGQTFTNFVFKSQPTPNAGTFQVIICQPKNGNLTQTEVTFVDVVDITTRTAGLVGEFHTVSRKSPPSSITKDNQKVFNGDGDRALIGSIYKADETTLTETWSRKNKFESYPLLRISAEDDLRIQPNPIKVFSGNIYGQLPYLSVVTINNIVGLFMFTEYSFDLKTNVLSANLTQFYNNDLGDIAYQFSYDYGNNTIRPTIKG